MMDYQVAKASVNQIDNVITIFICVWHWKNVNHADNIFFFCVIFSSPEIYIFDIASTWYS